MTNIFRPSRREISVLRKSFLESTKLLGRTCHLIQPVSRTLDKYTTTDTYSYTNAIRYPYYVHFINEPKKKMLDLFGWSYESKDEKPLLADMPMYRYPHATDPTTAYLNVNGVSVVPVVISEGCILELESYDHTEVTKVIQQFEVEKVISGDDRVNYLVNLVPRKILTFGVDPEDRPESGSTFIRQSDE